MQFRDAPQLRPDEILVGLESVLRQYTGHTRDIGNSPCAPMGARARTQRARQPSSLLSRTGVNRGRGAPLRHCLCGEDADPRPRAPLAERTLYAA